MERLHTENGYIIVTKIGDTYNLAFSNNIPDINGVKFQQNGDVLVSLTTNISGLIKLDAHNLTIGVNKDGAAWTASCKR